MTTPIQNRTITFAADETIALDLRNMVWPMGFTVRPAAGATVARKASNGNRPGNKFANPPTNDALTANFNFGQTDPISFASFAANASGGGALDISAVNAADVVVHNSTDDTPTAQTVPTQSIAVGEVLTLNARDLFLYEVDNRDQSGVLDLTATSAAPATATATVDAEGGSITVTGVAAGTVNVTVTATTPAEATENVVISVTVA